jgi:hypothetical protein
VRNVLSPEWGWCSRSNDVKYTLRFILQALACFPLLCEFKGTRGLWMYFSNVINIIALMCMIPHQMGQSIGRRKVPYPF